MRLRKVWRAIRELWTGDEQFYKGQAVVVSETDNSRGGPGHVVCDMGDTVEVRLEGDLEAIEVSQDRVHAINYRCAGVAP